MEPKKVSPEEVRTALALLATQSPPAARSLDEHLAALTAERDGLSESRVRALNDLSNKELEMRTLRERVRALDQEVDFANEALGTPAGVTLRDHAAAVASRLSGILQRAGEKDTLWRLFNAEVSITKGLRAAVRYVVGDGATGAAPSDPTGCTCGADDEPEGSPDKSHTRACAPRRPSEPAPTTAEAFATVLKGLGPFPAHGERDAAAHALSLLERRMGAMGKALRGCRTHLKCTTGCACDVCSALTDAPPVFTLEEVRSTMLGDGHTAEDTEQVVTGLSALRR
jgi:hypothetical protein